MTYPLLTYGSGKMKCSPSLSADLDNKSLSGKTMHKRRRIPARPYGRDTIGQALHLAAGAVLVPGYDWDFWRVLSEKKSFFEYILFCIALLNKIHYNKTTKKDLSAKYRRIYEWIFNETQNRFRF